MNYQNNDMIDGMCKYFNRIDLLMFSHTNKRFNLYSKIFIKKYKNSLAKFNINITIINIEFSQTIFVFFNEYFTVQIKSFVSMRKHQQINSIKIFTHTINHIIILIIHY